MIAKPYIRFLLGEILKNKNYYYTVVCYDDTAVELTRDLSECANQKAGDKYKGVNAYDECQIYIHDASSYLKGEKTFEDIKMDNAVGALFWTNWNEGIEKLYDYSLNLEKQVKTANEKYARQVEFI